MVYSYYKDSLSGERLKRVYEIAPPRVRRYLEEEAGHVVELAPPGAAILELGCGYGRVLPCLAAKARAVIGIDTSCENLKMGRRDLEGLRNCGLICMDAALLGFKDRYFDCVVCIQNGISAFHVEKRALVREAVRVTRPGGLAVFSTYSESFWYDRLEWFELQAREGLIGEIDHEKTGNGAIVCKDGFTATTVSPDGFRALTQDLDAEVNLIEVDRSSLFCEIMPHGNRAGGEG
jgi:2-polyprenyl-6-hydroxyphenyl methylase/3-demethylubiquinone-9 3-methyltransferase